MNVMITKLETSSPHALPPFDVFTRLADARKDWTELFACASTSPYQNYDYVSLWFETLGRERGLAPLIVVARDPLGAPVALYPLATRRTMGLRIAKFLCERDSNFNLGLVRPGAAPDARRLLLAAARNDANSVDLYVLHNQPRRFGGTDNPLAQGQASPSFVAR